MQNHKELISRLNLAIKILEPWERHSGPSWKNRFIRLSRYHYKYLVFLFSKTYPIKMSSSTFFGEKIYYRLPEHFYFLFSSFFPEVNSTNERNLTVYLIRNLKKETTFFDIGANCGFYTLLAYHLMEGKGHVHAFEPTPQIVALLRKSVKKFPNIIVNQVAVSDSRGQADFYLNKFSVGNTMDVHYVLNSFLEFSKISVPTISIDEYCQINKTYPDFIKIDVEGSEGKVIEGALDMIAVKHPIIAMEVWKDPIFSHKKAVSQLFELGYKMYNIDSSGEPYFVCDKERDFLRMKFDGGLQTYHNFLFMI